VLFVAEENGRVTKLGLQSPNAYSTVVSGLSYPVSVVLNEAKSVMYIAERTGNRVRRVFLNPDNTESSKEVAVSGIPSAEGLALSKDSSVLYVGQFVYQSGSVWRVPLSASGSVAATINMKIASGLNRPRSLLLSADDTLLYVAEEDAAAGNVRRYELVSGSYASVILQSGMHRPFGLALIPAEDKLIVSELKAANTVSYLSPLPAYSFAYTECDAMQFESRAPTPSSDRGCSALTVCAPNKAEAVAPTLTSDRQCTEEVAIVNSGLNVPFGIAITPAGEELYVVEHAGKRVWHVNLATNAKVSIRTLNAKAHGCALGNGVLFVAEENGRVTKLGLQSPNAYSTVVSGLSYPVSVVVNEAKSVMYIAERSSNRVRRVFLGADNTESSKEVAVTDITLAEGLALSKDSSVLYVGQYVNSGSVWHVPLSASGTVAATDSMKIVSGLSRPRGLLLSTDETLLYVAEDIAGKVHRYELVSGSYASVTLQSDMSRPYGLALTQGEEKLIVSEFAATTVSYLSPLPAYPSLSPSGQSSSQPSGEPSGQPSGQPSQPTSQPTDQGLEIIQAVGAGGSNSDFGYGISALADGSALVTGLFQGTASFGSGISLTSAGPADIFVAKVSSSGAWVWALRAGGSYYDFGYRISALADGSALVTGHFRGTASFDSGISLTSSAGSYDIFVMKVL
jgi:DNA-binding beta-propeller fold protein YncE